MPIDHEIVDNRYILFRGHGRVTGSEIMGSNQWLYTELENRDIAKFQIFDSSAVTDIKIDTADIRQLAEQDRSALKSLSRIAIAIVAPADIQYGLSRMWQAFSHTDEGNLQTGVFRDMQQAENWLHTHM